MPEPGDIVEGKIDHFNEHQNAVLKIGSSEYVLIDDWYLPKHYQKLEDRGYTVGDALNVRVLGSNWVSTPDWKKTVEGEKQGYDHEIFAKVTMISNNRNAFGVAIEGVHKGEKLFLGRVNGTVGTRVPVLLLSSIVNDQTRVAICTDQELWGGDYVMKLRSATDILPSDISQLKESIRKGEKIKKEDLIAKNQYIGGDHSAEPQGSSPDTSSENKERESDSTINQPSTTDLDNQTTESTSESSASSGSSSSNESDSSSHSSILRPIEESPCRVPSDPLESRSQTYETDPSEKAKSHQSHEDALNLLVEHLEPEFECFDVEGGSDLIATDNIGSVLQAEAKSLSNANSNKQQIRLALGQLQEYRYFDIIRPGRYTDLSLTQALLFDGEPSGRYRKFVDWLSEEETLVFWIDNGKLEGTENSITKLESLVN